jgi:DNA-binding transcriptional MerR regulator
MQSDQISKKELLDLTGISYGQLYRWKRKGLIPEDWFIRKAAFTGQETFFPREEILARIEKIKNMKEDLSLEDIAVKFSPLASEVKMSGDELVERKISSQSVLEIFSRTHPDRASFAFQDIFALYVMNKLLQSGALNLEEAESAVKTLQEGYPGFEGKTYDLIVIRKLGVAACIVASSAAPLYFDDNVKIVVRANLSTCLEELKILM